jgi:hypothetical protein
MDFLALMIVQLFKALLIEELDFYLKYIYTSSIKIHKKAFKAFLPTIPMGTVSDLNVTAGEFAKFSICCFSFWK